jgi:hypothetical protein
MLLVVPSIFQTIPVFKFELVPQIKLLPELEPSKPSAHFSVPDLENARAEKDVVEELSKQLSKNNFVEANEDPNLACIEDDPDPVSCLNV